jgi:hypothetical protein
MLEVRDETNLMTPPAALPAWTNDTAWSLYRLPFNDLLFQAQTVHRQHFDPNRVAAFKAPQHQDRRLPGGLRLLQPVLASFDRPRRRKADGR